jgi:hypothetical protein
MLVAEALFVRPSATGQQSNTGERAGSIPATAIGFYTGGLTNDD